MAQKTLKDENIEIVAEDVGGSVVGSILSFNSDGTISIRKSNEKYTI